MIDQVTFSHFCDAFWDTYKNNFSYDGKRALFDYLESIEEDTGQPVDLDIVALCCEYSEYDSALDCIKDCGYDFEPDTYTSPSEQEEAALEWLEEQTTVIPFDKGIIIASF